MGVTKRDLERGWRAFAHDNQEEHGYCSTYWVRINKDGPFVGRPAVDDDGMVELRCLIGVYDDGEVTPPERAIPAGRWHVDALNNYHPVPYDDLDVWAEGDG